MAHNAQARVSFRMIARFVVCFRKKATIANHWNALVARFISTRFAMVAAELLGAKSPTRWTRNFQKQALEAKCSGKRPQNN